MSQNQRKLWLVVVMSFLLTGSSPAHMPVAQHPKSILDYYFLLPHKYLAFLANDSQPAREAAIQIKDLEADFLKSGEATDEISATLALFKRSDGNDMVAVENRSCVGLCSSSLKLLSFANDRWVDVTPEVLPTIDKSKIQAFLEKQYTKRPGDPSPQPQFIYTLRKGGQSIEVNEVWSGIVLGQLEWAGDAFTFKAEEATGSSSRVLATAENAAGDRLQIIGIDPELPASLPINGHLRIKIAYEFKSGKYFFLRLRPVFMEERRSDLFTSGSMRYKPGSGVTTAYFGLNNLAHVNLLKVVMEDEQRKPILTLPYNIDANWIGTRDCPKFHVECFPAVDYSRPVLACMVYPSGLRPGQELTYSWSLANAAIASGQGTYRITVDLTNPEAETMTANLKIGMLGPNCESRASFTLPLKELIKSKVGN